MTKNARLLNPSGINWPLHFKQSSATQLLCSGQKLRTWLRWEPGTASSWLLAPGSPGWHSSSPRLWEALSQPLCPFCLHGIRLIIHEDVNDGYPRADDYLLVFSYKLLCGIFSCYLIDGMWMNSPPSQSEFVPLLNTLLPSSESLFPQALTLRISALSFSQC